MKSKFKNLKVEKLNYYSINKRINNGTEEINN